MNFARLAADRRANVTATYKRMQENNDHDYNIQRAVELENAHAERHRMNDRGRLTTVHTRRQDAIVDQAQATRARAAQQARREALIARRAERDARIAARAAERQGIADRNARRARNRAARAAEQQGVDQNARRARLREGDFRSEIERATDDAAVVRNARLGAVGRARRNLGDSHPPNSQADTPRQRLQLAKLLVPSTTLAGMDLQRYSLEGLTDDELRIRRTLAAALANPVLRASGNAKMTARLLARNLIARRRAQ